MLSSQNEVEVGEDSKAVDRLIVDRGLVDVINLVKYFPKRGRLLPRVTSWIKAVDGVSFTIPEGETLGLVGESGSGKTTVGMTILHLLKPTSGTVYFDGKDIFKLNGNELKALRREMQIIFQDPFSSLDPRMTVEDAVSEGLRIHGIGNANERREITMETLRKVGLSDSHRKRYPHAFSGGQRQRINIARALALRPKFIVADEPVSALDVSIQAQVLNLLSDLQEEFGLTYLFIAHDLSVIEHISDQVAVMYLGKIVELASKVDLYLNPLHPYTQALMSAIPSADPTNRNKRISLVGEWEESPDSLSGCRFHPRCPVAMDYCKIREPRFLEVAKGHSTACWRIE
ncbi:MAG: ATP-binding cassette domain-containing protein [Anaerolineales bacterium]|nr:ATP-binding cassette domain-containing protein [Anaerolineales bacterium]